jgi:hypothetical protein
MPSKECLPYKDQDIIGNIAVTRNQPEQSIGMKGAGASTTLSYRLVGDAIDTRLRCVISDPPCENSSKYYWERNQVRH